MSCPLYQSGPRQGNMDAAELLVDQASAFDRRPPLNDLRVGRTREFRQVTRNFSVITLRHKATKRTCRHRVNAMEIPGKLHEHARISSPHVPEPCMR